MSDTNGCAEFNEVAAELAVGVLTGSQRAGAVAHLARCPVCRQLMVELTSAADDLLLVAPEMEPPSGFESRVLARLADERRPRRSRWRSVAAIAAVALVAALGGGLIGQAVSDDDGPGPLRTALAVSASGRTTCRVVVSGDGPSTLLISLDGPADRSADYTAEVQPAGGAVIPVGKFTMHDGHGMLTASITPHAAEVKSIRVFSMEGQLLYEAFPAPAPGHVA